MENTNISGDIRNVPSSSRFRHPTHPTEMGAYGLRMAALLHLEAAPVVEVKTRRNAPIAVTRLCSETALLERTEQVPCEQAFSVHLHLRAASAIRLWYHGRPVTVDPNREEGGVSIVDLDQEASMYIGGAFDIVQIYLPRLALDEYADEIGGRRCDTLACPAGRIDPTLQHLGRSILPALEGTGSGHDLYAHHLIFALRAHIASTYGNIRVGETIARGGLAKWQTRRATEMLRAHMNGQISLAQVAQECNLSVSHFVRAFKQSLGQPPYRWLLEQRVEAAKDLLLHSGLPIAEIALRCGFADQACLIRAFRRATLTTPGEWRRSCATAPSGYLYADARQSKIYA